MANNSISQIIRQFLEMNQNSLETYEKISEAITTDKKTVTVDLFDQSGNLKTVQVPAFGYLKREIERLDQNFKSLSGLGQGDAAVRMADGTFRQIHKSKLKSPAKTVTSVSAPRTFTTKSNNFFESFLNPLLSIQLDVAGQVPADTEKIKVKRYLIDSTVAASAEWFDNNIKGSDSIEINGLISDLETNNIAYIIDEEVIDAPVRSTQYAGFFDVSKVKTAQRNVVVDGVSVTKSVKLYSLNKLTYTDAKKSQTDTETLKIGDELLVNSGTNSTKYRIVALNSDTLEVELLLLEGYEAIKVGNAQLKVYKNKEAYSSIDINVGFDERAAIFIKPVDPDSNLEAEFWSPGTAIYTNDLIITLANGEVQTLAQYYKEQVSDFGQLIKALKDDSIPPSTLGVVPDSPTLETGNFKVVQVNAHLTSNNAFEQIKKLNSSKTTAEENIKKLDEDLAARRSSIATKKYNTSVEKDRDRNELTAALNQRSAESKLYSSLVNEIRSLSDVNSVKSTAAKYRIRGFWTIPAPKKSANTIDQEVVQFKVQYRYLSADGKPAPITQIPFTDTVSGKEKTGAFSNWNEVMTPVRKRVKDEATGKYYWDSENVEDSQAININQLDLPIQSGEVVEIRVKSVSEAGWPANPVESEWSNIARVEFANGTQATESVVSIVDQNSAEIAKVKLMEELESRGLYSHVADSFAVNEKYFAHEAGSIASGFLTPEQSPINLFDKLTEMQNEILRLRNIIEGVQGELLVKIVREDGSSEVIQNNDNKQIFAGYYSDEIANLTVKKGHIVTKTFKIVIENTQATPLELISRLVGDRTLPTYNSSTSINNGFGTAPSTTVDPNVANDNYYRTVGKYDLVPVQYQNVSGLNLALPYFNDSPYQSGQLRGQFAYSRFKNIATDTDLYVYNNINLLDSSGANAFEYGMYDVSTFTPTTTSGEYIFEGTWTGTTPNTLPLATVTTATYDSGIFLHPSHPALASTTTYGDIYDNGGRFVQAKTANLKATDAEGFKQTAYYYDSALGRTVKSSFEPNDQYLLGGRSCGSYLFVAPLSATSLSVNADNNSGIKSIKIGENNAITIDVVFQYRMTDYSGISDSAAGFVGGIASTTLNNLSYSKKIGFDLFDKSGNQFSFDLEVFAKYKA
jgi:hypothetical protein